ncbi:MAG: LysM peptidoglycan-binding domain-containing protein [Deltaproteobacteria bacterium]|nr:LysM peptidoglycan-binding domain-containing protein [Deltaproteobacteria bacterium]
MSSLKRKLSVAAVALSLTTGLAAGGATAQENEGFGGEKKEGESQPANAPETYTVQPGDTLWNLSAKYLNNPWYWPKVWSYNPQLDNPNWIQPGTVIRFLPSDTQGGEIKPEKGPAEEEGNDEGDFGTDSPFYGVEEGGGFEAGKTEEAIRKMADRGKHHHSRLRWFATPEDVKSVGRLTHSPDESDYLSIGDRVYLDLDDDEYEGDFQIFRVVRELRHPISGANLGSVVKVSGLARVVAVQEGGEALAEIFKSWAEIRRGDLFSREISTKIKEIKARPADKELRGYIVDTSVDTNISAGENYLVFIDLGAGDGIVPGDIFTVVRALDPVTADSDDLADEEIGQVMVIDVRDGVATCEIRRSFKEVLAGDRIEMVPDEGD